MLGLRLRQAYSSTLLCKLTATDDVGLSGHTAIIRIVLTVICWGGRRCTWGETFYWVHTVRHRNCSRYSYDGEPCATPLVTRVPFHVAPQISK
jgi:hypothetical protein